MIKKIDNQQNNLQKNLNEVKKDLCMMYYLNLIIFSSDLIINREK